MMAFVQAEREGDWTLHLFAVEKMLPYFFASGHVNHFIQYLICISSSVITFSYTACYLAKFLDFFMSLNA